MKRRRRAPVSRDTRVRVQPRPTLLPRPDWVPPEAVLTAVWCNPDANGDYDPHAAVRLGVTLGFCEDGQELQRQALAEWPEDHIRCWCAERRDPLPTDDIFACFAAGPAHEACLRRLEPQGVPGAPGCSIVWAMLIRADPAIADRLPAAFSMCLDESPFASQYPTACARALRLLVGAHTEWFWTRVSQHGRYAIGETVLSALRRPVFADSVYAWPDDVYITMARAWYWPQRREMQCFLLSMAARRNDGCRIRAMVEAGANYEQAEYEDARFDIYPALRNLTDAEAMLLLLRHSGGRYWHWESLKLYNDPSVHEETIQQVMRNRIGALVHGIQWIGQRASWFPDSCVFIARLFAIGYYIVGPNTDFFVALLMWLVGMSDAEDAVRVKTILYSIKPGVFLPIVRSALEHCEADAETTAGAQLARAAIEMHKGHWQ